MPPWRATRDGLTLAVRVTPRGGRDAIDGIETMADGREILHSVDVGWTLDNIRAVKGKAAPWVKEDVPAVIGQLHWLNAILRQEPNVRLLVTHDDALFASMVAEGVIGSELQ